MEIEIELFVTASQRCPFDEWFKRIKEFHTRAKILTRLDRMKLGNFGNGIEEEKKWQKIKTIKIGY